MELLEGRDMLKEIESQEAVHGALRGQIMAGNREEFHPLPKTDNERDDDNREVFQSACRDDRDPSLRPGRITADSQRHHRRDDCGRCSGVKSHPENLCLSRALEKRVNDQKRPRERRFSRHCLEGGGVARREAVVGIGNQRQPLSAQHLPMDFIPAGAVYQEVPTLRHRSFPMHLINGNEQPLSVESLSNLPDGFAFHGKHNCTTASRRMPAQMGNWARTENIYGIKPFLLDLKRVEGRVGRGRRDERTDGGDKQHERAIQRAIRCWLLAIGNSE